MTLRQIDRQILKLAVPAIFNNITVPLLGLSDTAIAGHLGNVSYMGAMAVGAMMFNVIYLLCGFLRMGTTGLSAQAYGARSAESVSNILAKSLFIGFAISTLVLIFQRPLARFLLYIISPEAVVYDEATAYFSIVVWSVPAQLSLMAISGWFIGMQNTVIPMIIAVGVNIVNILLSVMLVFVWHVGFVGIATGTLVANWTGLFAAFFFLRREFRKIRKSSVFSGTSDISTTKEVAWSRFFSINSDLFIRSACIMGISLTVTSIGARLGDEILATNAVMMQFFLFFSYFMDGFAFAGEALVGKSAGARDRSALQTCVCALLKWGAGMAVVFFLIYLFGTRGITSLLTDSILVIDEVARMKFWLVILPLVTVSAFIFDGIFIGLARTRALMVVTLISSAVFFTLCILYSGTNGVPTNIILWCAFEAYLLLRGLLLAVRYLILQRKSLIL